MAEKVLCPFCGQMTDSDKPNCARCGAPMRVVRPPSDASLTRCPACGASVDRGDIICTSCGANLLKMAGKGANIQAATAEARAGRNWTRVLIWLMAGIVVLAGVAGAGVAVFWLTRDPVAQARAAAQRGELLTAINQLEAYLGRKPADGSAMVLLGKLYARAEQFDKACDTLLKALEQPNPDASWKMTAVVIATRLTGPDAMARQLKIIDRICRSGDVDERLWRLLALGYTVTDDRKALTDVLGRGRSEGKLDNETLALGLAAEGDLPAAEKQLRDLAVLSPDNGDYPAMVGLLLDAQGQSDAAIEFLEKALRNKTSLARWVGLRLGMLYLSRGEDQQALNALNQAKVAAPDDPEVLYYQAIALRLVGLREEALAQFERIAGMNTDLSGEAAVKMATLYLETGDVDKAASAARQAVERGVNTPELQVVQGRVQQALGNLSEAESAFRKAIQLNPDYPVAHLELGLLLVGRQAVAEGVQSLDRYLELVGDNRADTRAAEIEVLVSQLKQSVLSS
ncbi:MAG TPA: tetratricopeptide repeat protein [Candidatus Hydrogenedentes bacterium]|nr:tetratricopeptide repeat protein [Candidatus Hydrogenedentota bacterium]HOK89513.1 tetratricopeptide repeat protein [Candidatus Hydrogenedentota bacterium]